MKGRKFVHLLLGTALLFGMIGTGWAKQAQFPTKPI